MSTGNVTLGIATTKTLVGTLENKMDFSCQLYLIRLSGKESACQVGDAGSIPGSERSPGEGNGNPLQYSCLGNPDRGAWQATAYGVTKELNMT